MTADKRTCPQCGETVYPTDDVCMSCGADLRAKAAPAPPPVASPRGVPPPAAPPPEVPPGMPPVPVTRRPPAKDPFYTVVAASLGSAWDVFPWFYLLWSLGVTWIGFGSAPQMAQLILTVVGLILVPLFIFWLICDVLDRGVLFWWMFVGFCCGPIGLLLYLLKGRGD
jgi:hypothetical protein